MAGKNNTIYIAIALGIVALLTVFLIIAYFMLRSRRRASSMDVKLRWGNSNDAEGGDFGSTPKETLWERLMTRGVARGVVEVWGGEKVREKKKPGRAEKAISGTVRETAIHVIPPPAAARPAMPRNGHQALPAIVIPETAPPEVPEKEVFIPPLAAVSPLSVSPIASSPLSLRKSVPISTLDQKVSASSPLGAGPSTSIAVPPATVARHPYTPKLIIPVGTPLRDAVSPISAISPHTVMHSANSVGSPIDAGSATSTGPRRIYFRNPTATTGKKTSIGTESGMFMTAPLPPTSATAAGSEEDKDGLPEAAYYAMTNGGLQPRRDSEVQELSRTQTGISSRSYWDVPIRRSGNEGRLNPADIARKQSIASVTSIETSATTAASTVLSFSGSEEVVVVGGRRSGSGTAPGGGNGGDGWVAAELESGCVSPTTTTGKGGRSSEIIPPVPKIPEHYPLPKSPVGAPLSPISPLQSKVIVKRKPAPSHGSLMEKVLENNALRSSADAATMLSPTHMWLQTQQESQSPPASASASPRPGSIVMEVMAHFESLFGPASATPSPSSPASPPQEPKPKLPPIPPTPTTPSQKKPPPISRSCTCASARTTTTRVTASSDACHGTTCSVCAGRGQPDVDGVSRANTWRTASSGLSMMASPKTSTRNSPTLSFGTSNGGPFYKRASSLGNPQEQRSSAAPAPKGGVYSGTETMYLSTSTLMTSGGVESDVGAEGLGVDFEEAETEEQAKKREEERKQREEDARRRVSEYYPRYIQEYMTSRINADAATTKASPSPSPAPASPLPPTPQASSARASSSLSTSYPTTGSNSGSGNTTPRGRKPVQSTSSSSSAAGPVPTSLTPSASNTPSRSSSLHVEPDNKKGVIPYSLLNDKAKQPRKPVTSSPIITYPGGWDTFKSLNGSGEAAQDAEEEEEVVVVSASLNRPWSDGGVFEYVAASAATPRLGGGGGGSKGRGNTWETL